MINGKKVLAVIPARGGSKGVPRKNIRMVAGKPLIAWTIAEARKSQYIDRLIVSSEDEEILEVAKSWGCEAPFVRPEPLARDDTPGIDPVLHAIEAIGSAYDYVVLLQPTSPLRTVEDIDGSIEYCIKQGSFSCVTVTVPEQSPYWMYSLNSGGQLQPLLKAERKYNRRQDLPAVYILNGAVYVAECKWLRASRSFLAPETVGYIMPQVRSLDIDTDLDLLLAEQALSNNS